MYLILQESSHMFIKLQLLLNKKKKMTKKKTNNFIAPYQVFWRGLQAFHKAGRYPCPGGNAGAVLSCLPKAGITQLGDLLAEQETWKQGRARITSAKEAQRAIMTYEDTSLFCRWQTSYFKMQLVNWKFGCYSQNFKKKNH